MWAIFLAVAALFYLFSFGSSYLASALENEYLKEFFYISSGAFGLFSFAFAALTIFAVMLFFDSNKVYKGS